MKYEIDKNKILKSAVSTKSIFYPAIYVLFWEDNIVYVGKTSLDAIARIKFHADKKKFDKYAILNADDFGLTYEEFEKSLSVIEEALIMSFLPRYNKAITGLIYSSVRAVKREYQLTKWDIERLVSKHNIKPTVLGTTIYYKTDEIKRAVYN